MSSGLYKRMVVGFCSTKNPKFVYGEVMKGGGASRVDRHQELSVGFCVVSN